MQSIRVHGDVQSRARCMVFWGCFFVVVLASIGFAQLFPQSFVFKAELPEYKSKTMVWENNEFVRKNFSVSSDVEKGIQLINFEKTNVMFWLVSSLQPFFNISKLPNGTQVTYICNIFTQDDRKLISVENQTFKLVRPKLNSSNYLRQQVCYISKLDYDNYYVSIKVDANIELNKYFSQFSVDFVFMDRVFTKSLLALRYVFFFLSLISAVVFITKLKTIPEELRLLQQKMLMFLSAFLVLYNDPFFALYIFVPNVGSNILGAFFLTNFASYIIYFWMRMMYHVNYPITQLQDPHKKYHIAGYVLVFISTFALYFAFQLGILRGPLDESTIPAVNGLKIFASIVYVAVFVYMLFYFVQACRRNDQLVWRNNNFILYSGFYIPLSLLALGDLGFSLYNFAGDNLLVLVMNGNFYIWMLQYVYWPLDECDQQMNNIAGSGQIYRESSQQVQIMLENGTQPEEVRGGFINFEDES